MCRALLFFWAISFSGVCSAKFVCGPFTIWPDDEQGLRVNGEWVKEVRGGFTGKPGDATHLVMLFSMPSSNHWRQYGFRFSRLGGDKAILTVQDLKDTYRMQSFDCKKIS